jgi:Fe-S cluster biogenesis protein NfuA
MAEIMDYLSTGEDIVATENYDTENVAGQINSLLNARIRPAVKKDGGDIKFLKFEDGVVFVEMQGACKGCPYAMRTLKDGVERILRTYIPQVKEVRNVDENNS